MAKTEPKDPTEQPAAEAQVDLYDVAQRVQALELRAWFMEQLPIRTPRTLIDMTIEKLGELCGDPSGGDAPSAA